MSFNRKKKQNDFEKLFDLDPTEEEKVKKEKTEKEITPEEAEKIRKRKSFLRKIIVIAFPAVIILIAAILLISHHINNSGYRLEIKTMTSAIMADDATAVCENLSAITYDGMSYEEYLPKRYLTVKALTDSFIDGLEEDSGTVESTKFRVDKSEKLSRAEIEDLVSNTVDEGTEPSISVSDIDQVKRVDLKLTVNGSKFTTTYMIYDVYMVNENDQWKVYIDTDQLNIEQVSQTFPKD